MLILAAVVLLPGRIEPAAPGPVVAIVVGGAWVAASHGALARVVGGPGAPSWVAAGVEGAVRGAGLDAVGGVALVCLCVGCY